MHQNGLFEIAPGFHDMSTQPGAYPNSNAKLLCHKSIVIKNLSKS